MTDGHATQKGRGVNPAAGLNQGLNPGGGAGCVVLGRACRPPGSSPALLPAPGIPAPGKGEGSRAAPRAVCVRYQA